MLSKILVLVTLVAYTTCLTKPGTCPDHPTTLNFNTTLFSGDWYDNIHTTRGTGLELKCDVTRFSSSGSNKLTFSSFAYSIATKQTIGVSGDVEVPSPAVGKLIVHIPSLNLKGEVRVLSTDYTTFAVLWTCNNVGGSHNEGALVLTRDKTPSLSLKLATLKILSNNNITKKELSYSSQLLCPTYDLSAVGLSNSLGAGTSMGSLLSIYGATPVNATTG